VNVEASHVESARDIVISFLEPLQGRDWKAAIPDLEWDCKRVLQHVINSEIYYAMLLATRANAPIPFPRGAAAASGLTPGELLVELRGSASVLSAVIRDAPREARAFHSGRNADAAGFAAVACDELLVHAWDIGRGLSETFAAPDDLTRRVLARLFPWAPTRGEPWSTFLWCNGRIALDGRGRLEPDWPRWVAPLEEWDGIDPTSSSK
jgi:uncharacterized protein (TIGR03083 family)